MIKIQIYNAYLKPCQALLYNFTIVKDLDGRLMNELIIEVES